MKRLFLITASFYCVFAAKAQWTTLPNGNVHVTNLAAKVAIGHNNPAFALDVNGWIYSHDILLVDTKAGSEKTVWFRGAPNGGSSNMVIQGGGDGQAAYWISANNAGIKIGAHGGTEPSAGVINIGVNGNVGIGTMNPGTFKLAVEGKIGAREVKVTLSNPWPDYVFAKLYRLRPLSEVEQFILNNKHLPGIPSAEEIKTDGGINLGDMNSKLLQKIEELTLYIIEINKKVEKLEENAALKK